MGVSHPDRWPDNDLIAVGGDLNPATLVNAYRRGIFPMEVTALQKQARLVVARSARHRPARSACAITKSMRQSAKRFEVRVDTCFVDVMRACGDPSREDGWITGEFVDAYTSLHELGGRTASRCSIAKAGWPAGSYGVRDRRALRRTSRCSTRSGTRRRSR